jgi:hypothetical protein
MLVTSSKHFSEHPHPVLPKVGQREGRLTERQPALPGSGVDIYGVQGCRLSHFPEDRFGVSARAGGMLDAILRATDHLRSAGGGLFSWA